MLPPWLNADCSITLCSHVDTKGGNAVGSSTWYCKDDNVNSFVRFCHTLCTKTRISGLQARHQAHWSDQSDTHTVLAFMLPTTRLVSPLLLFLSSPLFILTPLISVTVSLSLCRHHSRLTPQPHPSPISLANFVAPATLLDPHSVCSFKLTLQLYGVLL